MPLVEHLIELRRRLMRSAIGILLGAVAGWFVAPFLLQSLSGPLTRQGGRILSAVNYPTITAAFDVRLEISIITGVVLSSPLWLYQIFAFLTPAFTRKEKRFVFGFFFSAVPLFLAGCASGWALIPHIVSLMTGFASAGSTTFIDGKAYLDFVLRLMLVVGIAFVLPVFLVLLNFAGVISGRAILHGWRFALLAITIFTAVATPSADVVSMLLLAAPMVVLYFVAAGIGVLHDRRTAASRDAYLADAA